MNGDDKKNIASAVNNLIKLGSKQVKKVKTPKINTIDIWESNKKYFSKEIQTAMTNRVSSTLYQYNDIMDMENAKPMAPHDPAESLLWMANSEKYKTEKWQLYRTFCKLGLELDVQYIRKCVPVQFFGCRLDKYKKDSTAAKVLANELEPLAKQGFIKGALAPMIKIPLMDHIASNESKTKAICMYIAVSEEGYKYLQNNPSKYEFKDGGIPLKLNGG